MSRNRWMVALTVSLCLIGSAMAGPFQWVDTFDHDAAGGDWGGAEIGAYDTATNQLFVTGSDGVQVLNVASDGTLSSEQVLGFDKVNSVAVSNGVLAVAHENSDSTQAGYVTLINTSNLAQQDQYNAGVLPDMVTITGSRALVANEGEPNDDYTVDPEGSVTIVDFSSGIDSAVETQLSFQSFNGQQAAIRTDGGRIFGPGASVAQDLEPEYIAVTEDGSKAFVSLQENNAFAVVDLSATPSITAIHGLGVKDFSQAGNETNLTNKDDRAVPNSADFGVNIWGIYQPDAIASYHHNGVNYVVTANEGDARDYDGYSEETRVADETWDDGSGVSGSMLDDENLGRLKITTADSDTDGDGDMDEVFSYGGRSFSIFDENGDLVYDCGNLLEQAVNDAGLHVEKRDDDKGPEPEGVVLGEMDGKLYAFVGLERASAVAIFDITGDPTDPSFAPSLLQVLHTDGDLEPEGLIFLDALASPTGEAMLIVTNEDSETTSIYQVPEPATMTLLGMGGLAALLRRRRNG